MIYTPVLLLGVLPASHPDWQGQEVQVQGGAGLPCHLHQQEGLPVLQVDNLRLPETMAWLC